MERIESSINENIFDEKTTKKSSIRCEDFDVSPKASFDVGNIVDKNSTTSFKPEMRSYANDRKQQQPFLGKLLGIKTILNKFKKTRDEQFWRQIKGGNRPKNVCVV